MAFQDKITEFDNEGDDNDDRRKAIYQSVINNIQKENVDKLYEYFCLKTIQDVKEFVKCVEINWLDGFCINTRQ